jgi:hypothetical protein
MRGHKRVAELGLLTVPEVAEWLRTSSKAIYAMSDRGQLPGAIRVDSRDLWWTFFQCCSPTFVPFRGHSCLLSPCAKLVSRGVPHCSWSMYQKILFPLNLD